MMVHDSLVICCMDTCPNQGIGEVSFPIILLPKEGVKGAFFLHRFAISVLKGVNCEVKPFEFLVSSNFRI